MPRLRTDEGVTDANLSANVWSYADLLAGIARASLREFVSGPWGAGDEALADRFRRRIYTPPCDRQCFVVQHREGEAVMNGCTCSASGFQYTDDVDVQRLEGCQPNDVWSDARALEAHHLKVGRGEDDPILCDCDDLTQICAAMQALDMWIAAGRPMKNGRPVDPKGLDVAVAIARPKETNIAHAFVLSNAVPRDGEPAIRVGKRYVFDPAARWGMHRPKNDFYWNGDVAVFPIRFADLFHPAAE